jgi:uncharacterized peroxidase-related enzyme
MAYIKLNNESLPGIVGLLDYSPATGKPLSDLAEVLLADEGNSLTKAEREIIAASVSYKNDCHFCHSSHAAAAAAHLQLGPEFIDDVKKGLQTTPVSDKLRALLNIAHQVQKGGRFVTEADIEQAREKGASDKEIHDTVLIAAAFCMYNRYVDGLGTWAPKDNAEFMPMGQQLAEHGYANAVAMEA